MCHKAQTLSDKAASYVQKTLNQIIDDKTKSSLSGFVKLMQLLHYNGIKPFYNCDVMKNDGTARHAMMLPTHPTAGRRRNNRIEGNNEQRSRKS